MVTAVLFVVLSLIYGVGFGDVLLISLILTGISYLGDMYVLPNTSNTVATLTDLALAFLVVWIVGGGIIEEDIPLVLASIISAVVIGVGEIFFHMYMERHVLDEDHERNPGRVSRENFGTEFGSDDPAVKKEYQKSSKSDDMEE